MYKISFVIIYILLINDLKPIESSNSIPSLTETLLSKSRSIKKRSPKLNNFFEDDKPISGNTDYIDLSNVYKDEIDEKVGQTPLKNRKRRLDDKHKEKRKRRKQRKHHKANRFKMKDSLDKLKRVSLRPSILNKLILNNKDEIEEQKHIISLQSEDHFHHLIIDDKNSSINDNNKVNLSIPNLPKFKQSIKPIKDALKLNQSDQNVELNKILDKIINEKIDRPTNTKTKNLEIDNLNKNNELNDKSRKPNYFGNFHLRIRTPKDLNMNELQNFTLITGTDLNREKELRLKLEQLKDSIDKLTNRMKISLNGKQEKVFNDHDNILDNKLDNNLNKKLKDDLKDKFISGRINRIKSKLNNLEKLNDKFQSKHLVCFKRPPLMSTFCYMVN